MSRQRPMRRSQDGQNRPGAALPHSSIVDAEQSTSHEPRVSRTLPHFRQPRPTDDLVEWFRGKFELAWENFLAPLFHWLVGIPLRLFGGWNRTVRLARGGHARVGLAWSWEVQGVRMLKQVTRGVMLAAIALAVFVVMIAVAVRITSAITRAAPAAIIVAGTATPTTTDASITIRNINANAGTVPPIPAFTFGMWMSDEAPGIGVTTRVFARVSNYSAPVPNVVVTISIGGQTFSGLTNHDGLAIFPVSSGGTNPVTVSGSVTVQGQTLNATTSFTAV